MKKIFNENQINSLLFKIKQGSINTVKRIIFPVAKDELSEKLTEIGELSRNPSTTIRPSIVTNDGVAYHFNDKGEINEISKSIEKKHGYGKIEILNKDQEGHVRDLEDGELLKVSIEVKTTKDSLEDIALSTGLHPYRIKTKEDINNEILNNLPDNLKSKK